MGAITRTHANLITTGGKISSLGVDGLIVQHVVGSSTASYSNLGTTPGATTTHTNLTNYSATITPTSTSNRLAFFCTLPYMVVGSLTGIVGLRIYDVTNAAIKGDNCFYHFEAGGHGGAGTAGKELPGVINLWDITPASTSATQYCVRLSAYVQSGSNQVAVNGVNYNVYFNIIEYEQAQ